MVTASRARLLWCTGLPARRIDAALEAHPAGRTGARAVSLLPMLDPYPMGYQDGTRADPALSDTAIDRGCNVTSVVLINGRIEGVWDLSEKPTSGPRSPPR